MFGFGLILITLASAAANATPTPTAPTPRPLFTYSVDLRAYYFGRTNGNSCLTCTPKGTPDATAFETSALVHGQLNIPHSPWALAATYDGAYPWGANALGPLGNVGYNPLVDNTLPGYSLSVFGEAYVQYKTAGMLGQLGKQVLTVKQSPWSPPSDSRTVPESYQGTLLSGNIGSNFEIGGMYIARYKSRVTSAFDANSVLTSCNTAFDTGKGPVEDVSGVFTVPGDTCYKLQKDKGFLQFSVQAIFGHSGVSAQAYYYQVYDITDMAYVNAQWSFAPKNHLNPYIAAQYFGENNIGQHLVGTIHSYAYGVQAGATIYRDLDLAVSYNGSPFTSYVVPKDACKGTVSSPQGPSPNVIFGGVEDTSARGVPPGDVQCYAGGIASPYTDTYATDPLYTTSIGQGLADVHKPGMAEKATLTWHAAHRRILLILSGAWYNYGLPGFSGTTSNGDQRNEFNADVTFFFNPPRAGPYKGFSLRQRYSDRTQSFSPYDFKYSRTQLEYTF